MTKRKTDAQRLTDQITDAWSNILKRAERDAWRIAAGVVPKPSSKPDPRP